MSGLMQLKAVDVRFGAVQALQGVDLRVAPGERLALIGANGSGKSTLLRVLHGLIRPSSGSVLRDSAMRQAMLFQRPYMLRTSALNNVALGLWIHGVRWPQTRQQALQALGRVGLADVAQRNARTLSGDSSSAWRWRGPGASRPTCCCWTSPPPAWTRTPSARSRR